MKKVFAKLAILAALLIAYSATSFGAEQEAWYCAGYVKVVMPKLPDTVEQQLAATSPVPIEKTIPGDLIFFGKIGRRWGCPNGFSGLVMHVDKDFIVFIVGVAEPKEQVLLLPTKGYDKGNTWYQLHPEIRTFEPETDPPRPGDKDYKSD